MRERQTGGKRSSRQPVSREGSLCIFGRETQERREGKILFSGKTMHSLPSKLVSYSLSGRQEECLCASRRHVRSRHRLDQFGALPLLSKIIIVISLITGLFPPIIHIASSSFDIHFSIKVCKVSTKIIVQQQRINYTLIIGELESLMFVVIHVNSGCHRFTPFRFSTLACDRPTFLQLLIK